MKCTLLGISPGLPHPEYNLSAVLVHVKNLNILADCGEGTARQLLRHKAGKDFLDAIIITHYHPDHVAGLFMLIQMLYLEGRKRPLPVFLPECPGCFTDMMHRFYTFEQRFSFKLTVHDMEELETAFPDVKPLPNDHLCGYKDVIRKNNYANLMRSFSLQFQEHGKSLIYTSDLGTFNGLQDELSAADLIVMDAMHPAAELISGFAINYRGHLVLTHGISPKLKTWLEANPRNNIELAQENRTYEC